MIITYTLLMHILPIGRTCNRICLVMRYDMLRLLRSITYAVVMVHTNYLDKRESERSFRNTGIGGCMARWCFFCGFFSRGCDLHTLLASSCGALFASLFPNNSKHITQSSVPFPRVNVIARYNVCSE